MDGLVALFGQVIVELLIFNDHYVNHKISRRETRRDN
jgi:hypothetical protein